MHEPRLGWQPPLDHLRRVAERGTEIRSRRPSPVIQPYFIRRSIPPRSTGGSGLRPIYAGVGLAGFGWGRGRAEIRGLGAADLSIRVQLEATRDRDVSEGST